LRNGQVERRAGSCRMKFARVIGTLVATQKYEGLEGVKFLVVQELDQDLNPAGDPTIAADGTAQAGPGMLTYVVASREAALALPVKFVPVDLAIVGIIDEVDRPNIARQIPNVIWHSQFISDK
jgi:ethanolamine utilization protein EutN